MSSASQARKLTTAPLPVPTLELDKATGAGKLEDQQT
jgi:hypothetical protein